MSTVQTIIAHADGSRTLLDLAALAGVSQQRVGKIIRDKGLPVKKAVRPGDWPPEREAKLRELVKARRTYAEIAEALGMSTDAVIGKVFRCGLKVRKATQAVAAGEHTLMTVAGRARALAELRRHVAAGLITPEIADAMGIDGRKIREFARKNKVTLTSRRAEPKPVPPKPQTIDEWLAIHGEPRKFEAGTLDQLLADTFASVGKTLGYSAGKGTSWTPYRIGSRNMNRAQVIAAANKIRAAQGKPLFSAPKRKAQSAAWGKARAA